VLRGQVHTGPRDLRAGRPGDERRAVLVRGGLPLGHDHAPDGADEGRRQRGAQPGSDRDAVSAHGNGTVGAEPP
jgi:hypothetical protein